MAKILVTTLREEKVLVDTNSKFETATKSSTVLVTTGKIVEGGLYLHPIKESMEEIQRLINEAESEATNAKLDLILETLESIKKRLDELDSREVISVEEF